MLKDSLKGKTFIAYSRCSTEEQRKQGNSHEYQLREIKAFGERNGMKIIGEFSDTTTGTNFVRPELDRAMELCRRMKNEIDFCLVYKQDRFGRDPLGALTVTKEFQDIGVEVNFTDEWVDYTDTSHPLTLMLKYAMAQTESLKIGERTRDGLYQTKLNGYHTANAPVGYYKVDSEEVGKSGRKRRICVPDENKAPIIKECFEMLISRTVSQAELFKMFGKRLEIGKSQFYRMLKDIFYTGKLYIKPYKNYEAKVIEGKHEGIISMDLYEKAQEVINEANQPNLGRTWSVNNKDMDSEYFLKGVIKCPNTGRMMTAYSVKGGRFHYYSTPSGKNKITIPVHKAHRLVRMALQELKINSETYEILKEELEERHDTETRHLIKQKKEFDNKLIQLNQRQITIEDSFADGSIDAKAFQRISDRILTDRSTTEANLIKVDESLSEGTDFKLRVLKLLSNIVTIYDNCSTREKSQLLRSLFPESFTLDLERGKVLTDEVNKYLFLNPCVSGECNVLEIKKETDFSTCLIMGERWDSNPRPPEPQTGALTN